jgi:hypothetical protein
MSVPKPTLVDETPDVKVSADDLICIESDGHYLCRFDAAAAVIFRTAATFLHIGRNYLVAYETGRGKYYLYKVIGMDPVVSPEETCPLRLELVSKGGNDIGNPPPKG